MVLKDFPSGNWFSVFEQCGFFSLNHPHHIDGFHSEDLPFERKKGRKRKRFEGNKNNLPKERYLFCVKHLLFLYATPYSNS